MRNLVVLGSTGEIGRRVLEVVRELPQYRLHTLVAHRRWRELREQVRSFGVPESVLVDERAAEEARSAWNGRTKLGTGVGAMLQAVASPEVDVVVCAIAGAAGVRASLEAVSHGKVLALANKESVVMAGELLLKTAERTGALVLPIDSEPSAIFQALRAGRREEVSRILLTASGGPFRNLSPKELAHVTPEQALRHPVWKMGRRITVDSATLMNKAMEIIEIRWLFGIAAERIRVLVHPQAIVHSIVEFRDGSMLAQMSTPDMRIPIRYALSFPDRVPAKNVSALDLACVRALTFEEPAEFWRTPIDLGRECSGGGTLGACLNGADEEAVEAFLQGRISFPQIVQGVAAVVRRHRSISDPTLEQIFEADAKARVELRKALGLPESS